METDVYNSPESDVSQNLNSEPTYAGFWIRVLATIVDAIVYACVTIPLSMLLIGTDYWSSDKLFHGAPDLLINYILPAVVTITFWLRLSATPGKLLCKIKVVDSQTGEKLSTGQAVIRYIGYIPAFAVLLLGILWIAWDKQKQGWHDKIAKTLVVKS